MIKTAIGRLRLVGLAEGVSFLVLLGIAMPLKYLANLPVAVTMAGWVHGLLFIAFCVALMQAREEASWDRRWTGRVALAALLPFGPFLIDARLRREDKKLRQRAGSYASSASP